MGLRHHTSPWSSGMLSCPHRGDLEQAATKDGEKSALKRGKEADEALLLRSKQDLPWHSSPAQHPVKQVAAFLLVVAHTSTAVTVLVRSRDADSGSNYSATFAVLLACAAQTLLFGALLVWLQSRREKAAALAWAPAGEKTALDGHTEHARTDSGIALLESVGRSLPEEPTRLLCALHAARRVAGSVVSSKGIYALVPGACLAGQSILRVLGATHLSAVAVLCFEQLSKPFAYHQPQTPGADGTRRWRSLPMQTACCILLAAGLLHLAAWTVWGQPSSLPGLLSAATGPSWHNYSMSNVYAVNPFERGGGPRLLSITSWHRSLSTSHVFPRVGIACLAASVLFGTTSQRLQSRPQPEPLEAVVLERTRLGAYAAVMAAFALALERMVDTTGRSVWDGFGALVWLSIGLSALEGFLALAAQQHLSPRTRGEW